MNGYNENPNKYIDFSQNIYTVESNPYVLPEEAFVYISFAGQSNSNVPDVFINNEVINKTYIGSSTFHTFFSGILKKGDTLQVKYPNSNTRALALPELQVFKLTSR